jgi:hypothetical protein
VHAHAADAIDGATRIAIVRLAMSRCDRSEKVAQRWRAARMSDDSLSATCAVLSAAVAARRKPVAKRCGQA